MAVELELLDQTRIFNVAKTKHPWKKVKKKMIHKDAKMAKIHHTLYLTFPILYP